MKLEIASAEDSEKLLSLSKEQMKGYLEENSLEWDEKERRVFLNESKVFLVLDPNFSGYLQLCEKGSELFIYDLQIIPESQGRGIGTKVIRSVFNMAKDQGLLAIRLGSFKSNPASKLYERLGFNAVRENQYFVWYRYVVA